MRGGFLLVLSFFFILPLAVRPFFPPSLPPSHNTTTGRPHPAGRPGRLPAVRGLRRRHPGGEPLPAGAAAGGRRGEARPAADYRGSGVGGGVGVPRRERRRGWARGDLGARRRGRGGARDAARLRQEGPRRQERPLCRFFLFLGGGRAGGSRFGFFFPLLFSTSSLFLSFSSTKIKIIRPGLDRARGPCSRRSRASRWPRRSSRRLCTGGSSRLEEGEGRGRRGGGSKRERMEQRERGGEGDERVLLFFL